MWRLTLAGTVLFLLSAEYSAEMCVGLAGNLRDLTVASSQYDILLCSETLIFDMPYVSVSLVPGFGRCVLLWRVKMPWARHTYEMVTEHFANPNFSVVVIVLCGLRQNHYVFSLYRNPDQGDRIFYCLLASMAAVQAEDIRGSFLFVGDLNGHHQEWLGSTTKNLHEVAAIDFAQLSPGRSVGCLPNPCT